LQGGGGNRARGAEAGPGVEVTRVSEGVLFVEERKQKILEHIAAQRKATVAELCELFRVSSATIRNDLRDLESTGLLVRTHGGAMIKSKTGHEQDMIARGVQNLSAKRAVAEAALRLIEDGDMIVLDTGSTVLELARLLDRRRDITVVTNDLTIATLLESFESVKIVFLGGIVRKRFHCTVFNDLSSRDLLAGLTVDKAFMGLNSYSLEKGASTPDIGHAETKKLMMSIAAKVVLLFDISKLGRNSFAQFASPDDVDTIVTDRISESDRKSLEDTGIEVIAAQNPRDTAAQNPRDTAAQNPRDTAAQNPRDTAAQNPRDTAAQ
jgi:DeoR family transcriptional regulator, fructose operon transcriptional repressor